MIRSDNKKEQVTLLILTFFVVYSFSYLLSDIFGRFMLKYGNPFVGSVNQPVSYINLAFTALVLTVAVFIQLIIKKADPKKIITELVVGICLTAVIIGGYFVNCNFIASAVKNGTVLDHFFYRASDGKLNEKYDDKETEEIIRLCEQLKPVPEKEQRKLEKKYQEAGEAADVISITVVYEERFGQNLDININIDGSKIYVDKGTGLHDKEAVVFFKDNGLTKYFR